jgi:polysaccharide export outer membrane protein
MNSIKKILSFLFLVLILGSCGFNRQLAYFNSTTRDTTVAISQNNFEAIIQTGDILFLGVTSLDPISSAMFNFSATGTSSGVGIGMQMQAPQNTTLGILVNTDGTIDLPKLGKVKAAGQTKNQLRVALTEALLPYLKEPVVTIRFMNYRVTVLGEVNRPGTIPILNERVSVLEALGLAGDLTMYGNRNNILLIHESNGIKETKRLSINDYSVFSSPYYYLQSNDVLYVEPNKAKAYISSPAAVLLPAFATSISLFVLVINSFVR